MTDIEDNQFQEVEEMFDKMLKQEFIAPDEVDEYSKVFKQSFLTIDNKEDFFPFLSRFIEQAENNDEYVEERLDSLRTEIESFFDKIGTNFSIHHIAGYKDPGDANKSNDSSDNIDESFSFIKTNDLNDNLFGPEIPEKHRPLVQKVLENISTLAQQKQDQRKQIITQWRYLAMADQIKKFKQQSPAINTIYKFLNKKYNLFYKLRSWSRYNDNKAKLLSSKDVITRYEKELEDLRKQLEEEINKKPKEVVKKTADPAQLAKIQKLQELLDKSNEDKKKLRDQLTEKQREELERNKLDMANQGKLSDLQAMMANLQRNKKRLENANDEKNKLLDDREQMLANSKKRLQELLDQFKDLEGKYKSKNLNHFQKFRFFMRIMNIFMLRMKAFGFMKIFKRKEKAKIALQNVTDRIKARLLIQTRNHNCGKDIRKSFLKWMIKANPDLMRSLLSKICLTSKINPTVSIWRLKKLVEKPFVAKLPEAVKAVRRLKAFFALDNLVKEKNKKSTKGFVDLINPHRFSIKGNKLKKVFDNAEENNKKKLKDIFKRLKHNKDIQGKILQKMIDNYLVQQRVAMWVLKLKRREGLNFDDMMKVNRLCQRLRDNKFISAKNFFKKFQNQNKIEGLISKLIGKQNMKQQKVINVMRQVNFDTKMKLNSETNTKYNLIQALVRAQNLKKRQALWKCILNQLNAQKNQDNDNSKLKNAFNKSFGRLNNTMRETLNRLRKHKNNELEKENKKNKLVKELVKKNLNKRDVAYSNIMNEISKAKQQESDTKDKMKTIFNNLCKAQNGKLRETLDKIKRHRQNLESQDNVKDKLVKKMVFFNKNNLLRDALQRLRDFRNQSQQNDKDTKIQEYALRMLMQRQQSKQQQALQSLINNKQNLKGDEDINHKIKQLMCKRLGSNTKENLAKVFYKLINHKNDEEKIELENDFKKKYAVRTVKLLAQNQQRQALDSIKSKKNQERNDKTSKALLRLITAQNAKQNNAVQHMKTELKNSSDQDAYNQSRKNKLLTALRGSMREKLLGMLGKLQVNSLQSQLEEEREKNKKRMLLQGLVNAMESKKKTAMYKVLMQDLIQQLQELKKRQQQQNFLNLLKKLDNKKKQAFKNLLKNAKQEKEQEEQLKSDQKKALNRLVQCQNRKAQIALDNLLRTAMQKKYDEELQRIKNKFKKMQEERKKKAQEEKMKRSIYCLRKWCKEQHNDQILKNNKLGKILNKTINHYNKALLDCIQKLLDNKEQAIRDLQEKEEKKKRQYEILGLDPGLIDQNKEVAAKIKNMLNNAGQSNEPIQKHIADLLEYMKNNNRNGLYDDIIQKIESKDINDPVDLLDYVNKNNQDGKYNELKKWINNPQLEMENLKHFMQLNNSDGRYNPILDEMKKNKDFNKIDLLEYIDNHNQDGKLNPLKNKIQDYTRIQEILDFLRRHNKDGKYDKILEWASKKTNPQLSDLQGYIKRHNQDGKLDDVLNKINEPELGTKQIARLVKFMKNNNGDGRYTEPLNYLFQKSIPKLSDLNQFFNQKNANEFKTLKDLFNHSRKTPGENFIEDLKNSPQRNLFEPIIKKYENKNPKITEIFNQLISTNNPANNAALDIMEKSNALAAYDKFMRRNNSKREYDGIKKALKSKKNAQLTDLMNAIKKFGDLNKVQPLLQKLNESEVLDSLKDFLQRKNVDGKYQTLIDHIDAQKKPDLYDAYQFVVNNKKKLDYKPIIDEINGKESDFPNPLQGYINKLKDSNDVTFQKLAQRINSMSTPTIPSVLKLVRKHNKYNKFDETFEWMDQTKPCQQVESLKGYLRYNKDMANMKPLNDILSSEKPKLTDLFNFISKNNEDGKLEILKEILNEDYKYDLLEEAVKFMKRNNQDGNYNDILNYVKNSKDPKLTGILDIIQQDDTGKYKDLVDVIEEKDRKKKFEELMKYIKAHNKDGKYNHLLQHLEQYKHPNVGDVIEYVTRNNHDKRYDDVIRFLLGKRFTTPDLLEKLKENNKDGYYDDIIKFIEKNPNQPIEVVIQKIKSLNDNDKYADLLDFLKNPSKDMPLDQNEEDDFFKMLSKAKKKGQYGDLFDYMKQNEMYDPDDILDYLKRNNKDGRFDDLIRQLEGCLKKQKQDNIKKTPKGFSIIYPQLQKMRQALQALLDHNYATKNKEDQDDLMRKQILKRLLLNHANLQRDAVKALEDNKNKKIDEENKLNQKMRKMLKHLEHAQNMKAKQSISSMYRNAKNRGGQQKDKDSKLSNVFNKAAIRYDRKKQKIIDELRNHNHTMQKIMSQLTGKLVTGNLAKQKQALQELIKNCRRRRDLEAKQKRLLDKLMKAQIAKEQQSVNCMKENNKNKKFNEKMNEYLKKRLLKQLKIAQEAKEKKVVEEFKQNRMQLLNDDDQKKNKMNRLFKKLVKAQQGKQQQCVNEFKVNKRLMRLRDKVKNRLFKNNAKNTKNLMKHVLDQLRDNKNKDLQKERENLQKLNHVFTKLPEKYLRAPFDAIVLNYPVQLFRNQKRKRAMDFVNRLCKDQQRDSYKKLQDALSQQQQEQRLKNRLVARLVNALRQKQDRVFDDMHKFAKNRTKELQRALQKIKIQVLREQSDYIQKLRQHYLQYRRNKFTSKLNNMLFCLKKNHKANIKQAFHHWNGTEKKKKIKVGTEILETLIRRRENNCYTTIKQYYLYLKFENIIQGLLKLMKLVDKKETQYKREFIELITIRNPWFQKVIKVWTTQCKPNDQIAFWRMRFGGNLKQEGVSADQVLKIKKLEYIAQKRIQHNISNSFWKIKVHSENTEGKERTTLKSMFMKYQ